MSLKRVKLNLITYRQLFSNKSQLRLLTQAIVKETVNIESTVDKKIAADARLGATL